MIFSNPPENIWKPEIFWWILGGMKKEYLPELS